MLWMMQSLNVFLYFDPSVPHHNKMFIFLCNAMQNVLLLKCKCNVFFIDNKKWLIQFLYFSITVTYEMHLRVFSGGVLVY